MANEIKALTIDGTRRMIKDETARTAAAAAQTTANSKQDELTFDTAPTSGSNNPVTSGGIYNAMQSFAPELPIASEDTLGAVMVDGTTITADENGVISGASTYVLPTASTSQLGGVKVDGDTVNIDANGVISTAPSAQADWNETDSTDPAYIVNKPFGYVAGDVTVIEQATFGGSTATFEGTVDGTRYAWVDSVIPLEEITNNTEYTLTVDGTVYTATSYYASKTFANSDDTRTSNVSGYYIKTPYCVVVKDQNSNYAHVLLATNGQWTTVPSRTVKLEGDGEVIQQIDPDFIPIDGTTVKLDANDKLSVDIEDAGAIPASEKGSAGGVAELDSNGLVLSSQLPSYVDDVLEFSNVSAFPATGESGKIYVALSTNRTYRWSGSSYIEISPSLALGETSSTAYRGDRGAAAYAHAVTNKGAAFSEDLYKITTNTEGHVTAATPATSADIVAFLNNQALSPASVTATGKVKAATIEDSGGTLAQLRYDHSLLRRQISASELADLCAAIATGTLQGSGFKIGDYFTGPSGYVYTIADVNTFYAPSAAYALVSTNHIALVVDTRATVQWNTSASTAGGYVASNIHSTLVNTHLPVVKTDMASLTGDAWSSHLIGHQKLYTSAMDSARYNRMGQASGASSSWVWSTDQYISALTEAQMYGHIVWSSSGHDTGEAFRHLEVFRRFTPYQILGRTDIWLRDIASSSSAAFAYRDGFAGSGSPADSFRACGLILFH